MVWNRLGGIRWKAGGECSDSSVVEDESRAAEARFYTRERWESRVGMVLPDSVPLPLALLAAALVTPLSLAVALFSVPFDLPGKVAVVVLGGVAQSTASFVALYRPVSNLRADTRAVLMQILLDDLRRDYGDTFDTEAELRASVMVPEKPFSEGLLPRRRKQFRIEYHSGDFGWAELDRR